METTKLLPLSGIAFVALVILAIPVLGWGSPSSAAAPDEVVAYHKEHSVEQFIAPIVLAAAVPFLVLFTLGISAVRSTEGGSAKWDRMFVGGSFVTGAVLLVVAMMYFALADGATNGASSSTVEALNLVIGSAWVAFNAGLGVLMLGAAGTFLSAPRSTPLGWSALVLGIALFIPIADFFALLLTGPWIIAASVVAGRSQSVGYHVAPEAA